MYTYRDTATWAARGRADLRGEGGEAPAVAASRGALFKEFTVVLCYVMLCLCVCFFFFFFFAAASRGAFVLFVLSWLVLCMLVLFMYVCCILCLTCLFSVCLVCFCFSTYLSYYVWFWLLVLVVVSDLLLFVLYHCFAAASRGAYVLVYSL